MGAFELNYSSDIDLIVFFDRECANCQGSGDLQSFFVRLTRDLVPLLEERTPDGYVFRTDLRLRPDAGRDAGGALDDGGARLLRNGRTELGTGRDDQGADLRRRHCGRRRPFWASSRPSYGANTSTSRPSPTSTP